MNKLDITTWKNLLDFLDMCDADGTIIYTTITSTPIPIDNFEFMKIGSTKDSDDPTFMVIEDNDGVLYLKGA
jgi:hypothetical protein